MPRLSCFLPHFVDQFAAFAGREKRRQWHLVLEMSETRIALTRAHPASTWPGWKGNSKRNKKRNKRDAEGRRCERVSENKYAMLTAPNASPLRQQQYLNCSLRSGAAGKAIRCRSNKHINKLTRVHKPLQIALEANIRVSGDNDSRGCSSNPHMNTHAHTHTHAHTLTHTCEN